MRLRNKERGRKMSRLVAEAEDEGLEILYSAMAYLRDRRDADVEQTGDFEAHAILATAAEQVEDQYTCRFCGNWTGKRNAYCSKSCAKADELGL